MCHQVFAEWERLSREEHRGALVPPSDWRAPPPAGYIDAQGMRRVEDDPWRPVRWGRSHNASWTSQRTLARGLPCLSHSPFRTKLLVMLRHARSALTFNAFEARGLCTQAGQDDGSCFLRHMTEAELTQQAAAC